MKIVYVNTPMQDENTQNPQVIDECTPKWCVNTEWVTKGLTLRQHLEKKWEYVKSRPNSEDVIGFYLYDVQPVHKIIDENGNYTGESAMFVRLDYMKKSHFHKKSIFDSLKDPNFGKYKNKVNHATLLDSPNSQKINESDLEDE